MKVATLLFYALAIWLLGAIAIAIGPVSSSQLPFDETALVPYVQWLGSLFFLILSVSTAIERGRAIRG